MPIPFLLFILNLALADDEPGNITDPSLCKLSHLGLEYHGSISSTESRVRCQSWSSNEPHKVVDFQDDSFSDFSRKRARNFCRNPNKDPLGPWCYSMNYDLKYETCGLPLCSFSDCRITGPGMEYSGQNDRGVSGRKCLKWNKDRKKVSEEGRTVAFKKFAKITFPEQDLSRARKYCRNPNGDAGGPWCFVEDEDTEIIEREYCDIPFCHEPDCEVFTKATATYQHFTDFNSSLTNLTFGIKLWDSDSYLNASARLILTLMALPVSGEEMEDLGVGIEISISNKRTELRYGNKNKGEYETTLGILTSNSYTMFSLSWAAPFVTLTLEGRIQPIFLAEYRIKKTLLGFKKNQFNFYSAQGSDVLWSFPFCEDDFECDVHTTTSSEHQQFWRLRRNEAGLDLQFYLRAFHSAYLRFTPSPTNSKSYTMLAIQRHASMTRVRVQADDGGTTVVKELPLPEILNYWEWREYSVSFFANTMQFYWTKSVGTFMIFEVQHELFRKMLWYSPSSDTIAHWTFFCLPPDVSKPPPAYLPECVINKEETGYKGTQDVTSDGKPCLPWGSPKLVPSEQYFSNNTYALENWNYCRDPKEENKGSFCYVFAKRKEVEKSFCRVRSCKSEECRLAGTGNDYMGPLNKTRSNRTCESWFSPNNVNPVDPKYLNATMYADASAEDIKNNCRNPSRDISGSWCYTTDPQVPRDLCNVRDCDRPEENILVTSLTDGRLIYILPQWKITGLEFGVKQWDPDTFDGFQFEFYSQNTSETIKLLIGSDKNEKIYFYHRGEWKKEKTYPHLISSGKWTDFWLVMRQGEISLGFKGLPNSLFEYKSDDIFDPMFMTFGSQETNFVGFFFKGDECHTENVTTSRYTKIMPIGLWAQKARIIYKSFILTVRGEGLVSIMLILLSGSIDSYYLEMDNLKNKILLYFGGKLLVNETRYAMFTTETWTIFNVNFNESILEVEKGNETLLQYRSESPMLFYWFSVSVTGGWVVWSANCDPLEIDGPPRDGGWSKWSHWHCTVTCGGGEGYRLRSCNNPTPNVKGQLCIGPHKSYGLCNNFNCGDLSPETLQKITTNLQGEENSLILREGQSILLKNNRDILKIVRKESPNAYYEWSFNGIVLDSQRGHVDLVGDDVQLDKVGRTDSGVYVCMLYRVNKKRVVLKVITLAVISRDYDLSTRATRSYNLLCKCVVLGYVYTDLTLKIYWNDGVYRDFGITMLAAVNSEELRSLNESNSGEWKCVVEQKDLGIKWVTNYVRIEVKSRSNFYTNLMEDELTKPVFGWLGNETNVKYALVCIVLLVIFAVLAGLFVYFKFCTFTTKWR